MSFRIPTLLHLVALLSTTCRGWHTSLPFGRPTPTHNSIISTKLSSDEELSGETLGDKYLLLNGEQESPSGKSHIYRAYEKCPQTGQPTGDEVVIKVSEDHEALKRESKNFNKLNDELFVETKEYIEPMTEGVNDSNNHYKMREEATNNPSEILQQNSALVMERGIGDLRQYVDKYGPIKEPELRYIAWTAAQCIHDMHQKGMVWTDLKSQNLILVPNDGGGQDLVIKGIDVESAVEYQGNPIDYTPRFSPPEFATRYLCGSELFMEMEYNFDIWSLGILLHELATGKHYFEGESHIEVATRLKNKGPDGMQRLVNEIEDIQLKDLIDRCLQIEPTDRPTIEEVAQHPYFVSTQQY